jgi:hypothetical protein
MNIIREILLNVEDDKYAYGERVKLDRFSYETCAYHVALIFDAGLAEGRILKSVSRPCAAAMIYRLTSAGHDFCDGLRHDTIWNKAKAHAIKYGLPVVIEYVKVELHHLAFGVPKV